MEGPPHSGLDLTEYFHFAVPKSVGTFTVNVPELDGSMDAVLENRLCTVTISKRGLQNEGLLKGLAVVKKRR